MKEDNFIAKVNGQSEFSISTKDIGKLDIIKEGENSYHILFNKKSYRISVQDFCPKSKQISLLINGSKQKIELKDQYDLLVEKMGLNERSTTNEKLILAPMPGVVIDVLAKENAEVNESDPLLILEAMKMENVLKSPASGKVKSILIKQGDPVDKNQLLIELE